MPTQTAVANVQAYLDRVDQLYAAVRGWVTDLDADAQFHETEVEIVEEATGTYKAKSLEVARTGKPALRLVPRGRYMVGADGRVDVRSQLGREMLVWVAAGGPAIGFRISTDGGRTLEELRGRPMFPDVSEGWAWADEARRRLLHLDAAVFRDQILTSVGE